MHRRERPCRTEPGRKEQVFFCVKPFWGYGGLKTAYIMRRTGYTRQRHFYCSRFMEAWKNSEKCMVSNKVSMFPALHYMFYGKVEGAEACNLAALRGLSCGNEIFQKIFREEFAGFWIKELGSMIERNESLGAMEDKIGTRMVTECAMELQDGQLMQYLMRKAREFTDNRTIITAQSYYRMIFGKEIGMNRNKFFELFVAQTDQVLEKEYALQCRRFPRENEIELTGSKEIWRIFHMHGPTLEVIIVADITSSITNQNKSIQYLSVSLLKQIDGTWLIADCTVIDTIYT